MATQTQARPLFAATLTPHRSLSRRGLRIVIALLVIVAGVPAMISLSYGAWPVIGFLVLDVLLVWWALAAARRSAKRFEEITLWPDQLELRQVSGRGKEETRRFNPFFVKLVIDRDFNERITALHLRSRDADIEIGTFLSTDDKTTFAKAFGTALKRARN